MTDEVEEPAGWEVLLFEEILMTIHEVVGAEDMGEGGDDMDEVVVEVLVRTTLATRHPRAIALPSTRCTQNALSLPPQPPGRVPTLWHLSLPIRVAMKVGKSCLGQHGRLLFEEGATRAATIEGTTPPPRTIIIITPATPVSIVDGVGALWMDEAQEGSRVGEVEDVVEAIWNEVVEAEGEGDLVVGEGVAIACRDDTRNHDVL